MRERDGENGLKEWHKEWSLQKGCYVIMLQQLYFNCTSASHKGIKSPTLEVLGLV